MIDSLLEEAPGSNEIYIVPARPPHQYSVLVSPGTSAAMRAPPRLEDRREKRGGRRRGLTSRVGQAFGRRGRRYRCGSHAMDNRSDAVLRSGRNAPQGNQQLSKASIRHLGETKANHSMSIDRLFPHPATLQASTYRSSSDPLHRARWSSRDAVFDGLESIPSFTLPLSI